MNGNIAAIVNPEPREIFDCRTHNHNIFWLNQKQKTKIPTKLSIFIMKGKV